MEFLMLPSVPFACIPLSDAAKNPALILSAELYGNANPKGVRKSAKHPKDSCSQHNSYRQRQGVKGQMSTGNWSVFTPWEAMFPLGEWEHLALSLPSS